MPDAAKYRALALAGALVAWSATAGLEVPGRRHPVVQAALGTGLALGARSRLGLRGPQLRAGMRWGALAATAVSAGVAVTAAVPPVRSAMATRPLPRPGWKWLAIEIPLGTVWSEEMAYRAALGTLTTAAFGPALGRSVQAGAFGLSHIVDARATGEPLVGTVVVTGLAGWAFGWLADRSGSVLAPVLTHLAINETGAVIASLLQRRSAR